MADNEKNIRILTMLFQIPAIILFAACIAGAVLGWFVMAKIPIDFTNYGSDTVSGWATIFSMLGLFGGVMGTVMAAAMIFMCIAAAIWCAVCIILAQIVKVNAEEQNNVCKVTAGIFAGINMFPWLLFALSAAADGRFGFFLVPMALLIYDVFLLRLVFAKE